jgi:hypothetical protein
MEITLIGLGTLASVIMYKIGYKKGKQDGHTVGYSHGMFKANELVNQQKLDETKELRKSFVGVKHRLTRVPQEPVWLG